MSQPPLSIYRHDLAWHHMPLDEVVEVVQLTSNTLMRGYHCGVHRACQNPRQQRDSDAGGPNILKCLVISLTRLPSFWESLL